MMKCTFEKIMTGKLKIITSRSMLSLKNKLEHFYTHKTTRILISNFSFFFWPWHVFSDPIGAVSWSLLFTNCCIISGRSASTQRSSSLYINFYTCVPLYALLWRPWAYCPHQPGSTWLGWDQTLHSDNLICLASLVPQERLLLLISWNM